ncbi:DUF7563 family protein [Halorussus marinus]
MPECANCGAFVTSNFQRVFAGRDGEVHGCFECRDKSEITNGAAAQP